MTTNLAATHPNELPATAAEPDDVTLVGEHALLLQGVHRRVWPVLALIDAGTWPTAELNTLVGFLRAWVLRQASDEETLLYPNDEAASFAELVAQHARLHALTEQLARANVTHCSLPELRRMVAELVNALGRHLATEQALLSRLAGTEHSVPSASALASGARTWHAPSDGPLLIVLDHFPRDLAAQLCIERVLRLRPGQVAEIRSSDESDLVRVDRWMRAFDTTGYCIDYVAANTPASHLEVTRRSGQ